MLPVVAWASNRVTWARRTIAGSVAPARQTRQRPAGPVSAIPRKSHSGNALGLEPGADLAPECAIRHRRAAAARFAISASRTGEEIADALDLAAVAEEDVQDRAAAMPTALAAKKRSPQITCRTCMNSALT